MRLVLIALLVAVAVAIGLNSEPRADWRIFEGYEGYLDRKIFYSTVRGDSMEPTIRDGQVILWVEVDPSELKVGDMIVYTHPTKRLENPIVHRIIRIMKNGKYLFETKGDNRSESDAETAIGAYFVGEEDLKGLVIGIKAL